MSTIYGTRTTRTGFIIMYQYGFDNISTFFATNFVSDYLHKIPCLIVFKSSYNKHITLSGVHQSLCSIRRLEQQRKALCSLRLSECPCCKPCFYPPINERRCFMQFLTHIIFLLNLLKTYNATVLLSCEADGRSKFSLEFENGGC